MMMAKYLIQHQVKFPMISRNKIRNLRVNKRMPMRLKNPFNQPQKKIMMMSTWIKANWMINKRWPKQMKILTMTKKKSRIPMIHLALRKNPPTNQEASQQKNPKPPKINNRTTKTLKLKNLTNNKKRRKAHQSKAKKKMIIK